MRDDLRYFNLYDAAFQECPLDPEEPDDLEAGGNHIHVGAGQQPCTFETLDENHRNDVAFTNFRVRLAKFLNISLKDTLPNGGKLVLRPHDMVRVSNSAPNCKDLTTLQIHEYRYLKVNFESAVDWRQAADFLRCSPKFHSRLRQDFVIVQTATGQPIFAQLLLLFKCRFAGKDYPLALIQPFDQPIPARERPKKDKDLDLYRVRARPRKLAEFIFMDSIIRGALLVNSFDSQYGDECFVIDTVDTDMFLQLRSLYCRR
jgi:hypothetical protein